MFIYNLLLNILYLASFIFFGEKICKFLKIDSNISAVSYKYLQYPIIAISFLAFLVSSLVFLNFNIKFTSYFINVILIFSGFYFLIKNLKNFYLIHLINFYKKEKILLILIISYLFLVFSPITDADSLAYHAYVPKKILSNNFFSYDLYNFHESLIGIMEFFYLIPMSLNSDVTLQIINFYCFLSVIGVFYNLYKIKIREKKNIKYFIFLIFSSPIFLFLIYTAKPQMIFISLSLLSLCLIEKINKKINYNLVYFLFFILIFNFLGKPSFLISSFVLTFFLIYKIYKYLTVELFLKLIFLILFCFIPILYSRYSLFNIFNINYFFNNIPTHLPGYSEFWNQLIKSQHSITFPLSLLIPSNVNSLTTSFGILPFLLIFFLKKINICYFLFLFFV